MRELIAGLPPLLAAHLELVLVALVAATATSIPLAIAAAQRPRLAFPIVTVAGVIQTIPGLALLALMVAVLAWTHGFGVGVSSFGFAPAAIALTLYAVLPILRNTITGLRGVDPAVVEAGRGIGMTPRQLLRYVQLPLAAPVIAAGVRTATVWTVGAATLATPVGQTCLGNYIFAGLQTRNSAMLLAGVIVAAGLAVVLDLVLGAIERALAKRTRVWPPLVALVAIVALGIWGVPRIGGHGAGTPTAAARTAPLAITQVRVGAKTFTEQYVLAEVLKQRLAGAGITVEVVAGLGSAVVFEALAAGAIDVYVDYSGTLWTTQLKRPFGAPRWRVRAELDGWLAARGIRSFGTLGFEDAYVLAMRRTTAERLHATQIGDIATAHLAIGGDYEWFSRGEWNAVRRVYGLEVSRTVTLDPALLYDAVARGEVDVISAFSSDGRIAANDLVVLADPRGALPPYDAMLLLGPRVADAPDVACALAPLRDQISLDLMRRANLMVDRKRDPQTPAHTAAWLLDQLDLVNDCR